MVFRCRCAVVDVFTFIYFSKIMRAPHKWQWKEATRGAWQFFLSSQTGERHQTLTMMTREERSDWVSSEVSLIIDGLVYRPLVECLAHMPV